MACRQAFQLPAPELYQKPLLSGIALGPSNDPLAKGWMADALTGLEECLVASG